MQLEYKVRIKQKHNPKLSRYEYLEDTLFKISKNFQGITLDSGDVNKGGFYRKSSKVVENYKQQGNLIRGEEVKVKTNTKNKEYLKEMFPVIEIKPFLDKYRAYLIPIKDMILDKKVSLEDKLDLLYIDNGIIIKLDNNEYSIDNKTLKIDTETDVFNNTLFGINFPVKYSYTKESGVTVIDVEEILNIDSGFYNLLPSRVHESYTIKEDNFKLTIESREILFLTSEFNITYDRTLDKNFFVTPNSILEISYNEQDYTPLLGIDFFSYIDDMSYVILELKGDTYIPKYKLPRDKDREDLKLLLQSHDEYKRPYSFIANKSKLSIRNISKTYTIYNPNFKELYNNF